MNFFQPQCQHATAAVAGNVHGFQSDGVGLAGEPIVMGIDDSFERFFGYAAFVAGVIAKPDERVT